MPKIVRVRPVLLSAPYADPATSAEVILHLPAARRTIGMVELTLDNGIVGLGEGYLAVFAPHVFRSIVELVAPVLQGRDPRELAPLLRELGLTTGYWSWQGAAQHVISACEIALQDCRAQLAGVSVARLLGAAEHRPLRLYASGGDSVTTAAMTRELDAVAALGIDVFKIRARRHEAAKTAWVQRHARPRGIAIAVDMTQNLAIPSQTIADILAYLGEVTARGGAAPWFLEEALGPEEIRRYPELRRRTAPMRIAGGEIVTTAAELAERIDAGCYDIAQPDATVLGGIGPTLEVFRAAAGAGAEVFVHSWGGPVAMMANYHAALAGGGRMAEWPLPFFPLRAALLPGAWRVERGELHVPDTPGLGLRLTPEIEREYAFREDAVYRCLTDPSRLPPMSWE
ncbi:MAG: mandelate racemase/muconate lactonizing enzyme family protein [Opitutaceae bacterium]|nr:mandelate racemase/muconate lactonizing enzyme family protein [Opitutaceae bacterium]